VFSYATSLDGCSCICVDGLNIYKSPELYPVFDLILLLFFFLSFSVKFVLIIHGAQSVKVNYKSLFKCFALLPVVPIGKTYSRAVYSVIYSVFSFGHLV
jgi:hypothetical protein